MSVGKSLAGLRGQVSEGMGGKNTSGSIHVTTMCHREAHIPVRTMVTQLVVT